MSMILDWPYFHQKDRLSRSAATPHRYGFSASLSLSLSLFPFLFLLGCLSNQVSISTSQRLRGQLECAPWITCVRVNINIRPIMESSHKRYAIDKTSRFSGRERSTFRKTRAIELCKMWHLVAIGPGYLSHEHPPDQI